MSVCYYSQLHYGLKLPDGEEIEDFPNMIFISCGNGYGDGEDNEYFLSIKKSIIHKYNDDNCDVPINPNHFMIDQSWNDKLLKAAKKIKIDNPIIGWWLTSYIC